MEKGNTLLDNVIDGKMTHPEEKLYPGVFRVARLLANSDRIETAIRKGDNNLALKINDQNKLHARVALLDIERGQTVVCAPR